MHDIHRHEICRFEHGDLLYRTYFFKDGEIAFTVTGDALRLGLITREDLRWDWDWMRELPGTTETSRIVNVNAQPLRVLRAIALRLRTCSRSVRWRYQYDCCLSLNFNRFKNF